MRGQGSNMANFIPDTSTYVYKSTFGEWGKDWFIGDPPVGSNWIPVPGETKTITVGDGVWTVPAKWRPPAMRPEEV